MDGKDPAAEVPPGTLTVRHLLGLLAAQGLSGVLQGEGPKLQRLADGSFLVVDVERGQHYEPQEFADEDAAARELSRRIGWVTGRW